MMTIKYAQQPLPLSQDEFHAVDYQVMGQAFALHPKEPKAQDIPSILKSLLDDWGAYLSTTLYKEALCHFLGLPLESECQRFMALSSDTALHISGLSSKKNNLQNNLQKYLRVSQWHELLWINFDKNHIGLSCLHDSA